MLKDCRVFFGGKVTVVATSLGVGKNNAVDQLTKAVLTLRGSYGATKVLRGDDGACVDAPELWKLSAALLEDGLTGLPVGLHHVAVFPGDLVVRVNPWNGVNAVDGNSLTCTAC